MTVRSAPMENAEQLRAHLVRVVSEPRPEGDNAERTTAVVEVASEALRRLDDGEHFDDVRAWAFQRFQALNPLPRATTQTVVCECGAILLDAGWSGSHEILCTVCGTTWGAERQESTYTTWTIRRPEATTWATENSIDGDRWRELFFSTIVALGGNADEIQSTIRLERSLDGMPREMRLTHRSGESTLFLREGVNIDLWLQGEALYEMQRQRRPPVHRIPTQEEIDHLREDGDGFEDEQYEYVPLATVDTTLASLAVDRYIKVLMSFAGLPRSLEDEVRSCVVIDVSVDPGTSDVRWLSRVSGCTSWYPEWDGTADAIIEIAEWKALNDAEWLDTERNIAGSTGWEA
ncbi:MAG: hypothetical protein ACXVKA_14645 [Acidimicrobiia bacterium]